MLKAITGGTGFFGYLGGTGLFGESGGTGLIMGKVITLATRISCPMIEESVLDPLSLFRLLCMEHLDMTPMAMHDAISQRQQCNCRC